MLLGYNTVKKFSGIDRMIEPLLGEMLNLLFITRSQFWCSRLEIILWVRIVQVEVLHGVQYVLVLWIKETVQIEELYGSALILVLC